MGLSSLRTLARMLFALKVIHSGIRFSWGAAQGWRSQKTGEKRRAEGDSHQTLPSTVLNFLAFVVFRVVILLTEHQDEATYNSTGRLFKG